MNIQTNLWHPNNPKLIWQISDNISGWNLFTIEATLNNLKWILDTESQNLINDFSNQFDSLLKELELEVNTLSATLSYRYNKESDYLRRITKTDDSLMDTFNILLKDKQWIGIIYEKIIELILPFPNAELIKKQIFDAYFYDLLIEYLRPWLTNRMWEWYCDYYDLPINYEYERMIKQFDAVLDVWLGSWLDYKSIKDAKAFEYEILGCDVLNFNTARLDIESERFSLQLYFQLYPNIKSWLFTLCDLDLLSNQELLAIFKNLNHAKFLRLEKNKLSRLSMSWLDTIFKNLHNLRYIKLGNNNFWGMDDNSLMTIFSNLWNIKYISLKENNLELLSNKALDIILSNLRWANCISLAGNDFSEEQINYIKQNYWDIYHNISYVLYNG